MGTAQFVDVVFRNQDTAKPAIFLRSALLADGRRVYISQDLRERQIYCRIPFLPTYASFV